MPLVIAAVLGLCALMIVVYPLLGLDHSPRSLEPVELLEASEQESSAKQALRDVDFDRRLGNLDEADYQALRERFEERALDAMKLRYERERELDARIERQLEALRAERPTRGLTTKPAKPAKSDASSGDPYVGTSVPRTPAESADGTNGKGPSTLRRRRGV